MDDLGESTTPIPSDSVFAVRDVVLAFHGHLLYEARVLLVHLIDGNAIDANDDVNATNDPGLVKSYTVHYQGWKKSWEETVPKHMVFEHNDENLRVAHRLLNGARRQQASSYPVSTSTTTTTNQQQQQHHQQQVKQQQQLHVEQEQDLSNNDIQKNTSPTTNTTNNNIDESALLESQEPHHQQTPTTTTTTANAHSNSIEKLFVLTAPLQRMLVDDWEYITKHHKLVTLPRDPSVTQILNKWLNMNTKRNGMDEAAKEVVDALLEYFDATLSKTLLYRFERKQYSDLFLHPTNRSSSTTTTTTTTITTTTNNTSKKSGCMLALSQHDNLRPSTVYGAEHLLRLIHKLPFMLECSCAERDTLQIVADKVNDLTKYIQRNSRFFFQQSYTPASKGYVKTVAV